MKTIYSLIFVTCLMVSNIMAQEKPKSLLYTNVTIHVGNGQLIENGVIGVKVWIYKGEVFDLYARNKTEDAGSQKAAS